MHTVHQLQTSQNGAEELVISRYISMEEPRTCHVSTMTADLTGGVDTYAHSAPAADIAE